MHMSKSGQQNTKADEGGQRPAKAKSPAAPAGSKSSSEAASPAKKGGSTDKKSGSGQRG
jgi:hypothetical protein